MFGGDDFGSLGGKALTARDTNVGGAKERRQNGELRPFLTQSGASMSRRPMRTVGVTPGEYAAEPLTAGQTGIPIKEDPYRSYVNDDRGTTSWGGLMCTVAAILITCAIAIPVTWAVTKNAFEGTSTSDVRHDLSRICALTSNGLLPADCQGWIKANYTNLATTWKSGQNVARGFSCVADTGGVCALAPPTGATCTYDKCTTHVAAANAAAATDKTSAVAAAHSAAAATAVTVKAASDLTLTQGMKLYTDELLKVAALEAKVKTLQATSGANMSWPAMCTSNPSACLTFAQTQLTASCTPSAGGTTYPAACASATTWAGTWATATGLCGAGSTPTLASCAASVTTTNPDGVCGTWAKSAAGGSLVELNAAACTTSKGAAAGGDGVCGIWARSSAGGSLIEATSCTAADACVAYTAMDKAGNPVVIGSKCVDAAFFTADKCIAVHGGTFAQTGLQLTPAPVASWTGAGGMPTQTEWSALQTNPTTAGQGVTGMFFIKLQGTGTGSGYNAFNTPQKAAMAAAIAQMFNTVDAAWVDVTVHEAMTTFPEAGTTPATFFHRRALQTTTDTCSAAATPCFYVLITIRFPTQANGASWNLVSSAMNQFQSTVHAGVLTTGTANFKLQLIQQFGSAQAIAGAASPALSTFTPVNFTDTTFSYAGVPSPPPSPPPPPVSPTPSPPPPSPPPSSTPSPPPPSPSPPPGPAPYMGDGTSIWNAAGTGAGAWECVNNFAVDGGDKDLDAGNCGWSTNSIVANNVDVGCCTDGDGLASFPLSSDEDVQTVGATTDTFETAKEYCADKCYRHDMEPGFDYPRNTPCAGFTVIATDDDNLPQTPQATVTYWATVGSKYACRLYSTCQAQKTHEGSAASGTLTRGRTALKPADTGHLSTVLTAATATFGLVGSDTVAADAPLGTLIVAVGTKTVQSLGNVFTAATTLPVVQPTDPTLAIATSDEYMAFPPKAVGTIVLTSTGFTTAMASGVQAATGDVFSLYTKVTSGTVYTFVATVTSTLVATTAVTATLLPEQIAALSASGITKHYTVHASTTNTGLLSGIVAADAATVIMATAGAPVAADLKPGSTVYADISGTPTLFGYAQSQAAATITLGGITTAGTNAHAATLAIDTPYYIFEPYEVGTVGTTTASAIPMVRTSAATTTPLTTDLIILYSKTSAEVVTIRHIIPASATGVVTITSATVRSVATTFLAASTAYTTFNNLVTGGTTTHYAVVSRVAAKTPTVALTRAAGLIGLETGIAATDVPPGTQLVVDGQDATFTALNLPASSTTLTLADDFQRTGPTAALDVYRRFTPLESGTIAGATVSAAGFTLAQTAPTAGTTTVATSADHLVLWSTVTLTPTTMAYIGTIPLTSATIVLTSGAVSTLPAGTLTASQIAAFTVTTNTYHYAIVSRDTFRSGALGAVTTTASKAVTLNAARKPATTLVLPGAQLVVKGEVAGTVITYASSTGIATLAKKAPTIFPVKSEYFVFPPSESGTVAGTHVSATGLTLAPTTTGVTVSAAAVGSKLVLWTKTGSVNTYVTTITLGAAAASNVVTHALAADIVAALKVTTVTIGYAIVSADLAFSAPIALAVGSTAQSVEVLKTVIDPADIAIGSRLTLSGAAAGYTLNVNAGSTAARYAVQLTAVASVIAPVASTAAFYPPRESGFISTVTAAVTGTTGSFVIPTTTIAATDDTIVVWTQLTATGTAAFVGTFKVKSAVTNGIVIPVVALSPVEYGKIVGATGDALAATNAYYALASGNINDATCAVANMPKSFATTTCTIETQAHNCANGRDFCCSPSTANVMNPDYTCAYPTTSAGALELGRCGTANAYVSGTAPVPVTTPFMCPNPTTMASGVIQASPLSNCDALKYPTTVTSDPDQFGCCADQGGDTLPGLLMPSGSYYTTVLATGLNGIGVGGTFADTSIGANAKCQAQCDAYTVTTGGWDCNGYDVRLHATGDSYALPVGATLTWLTVWNSQTPGYAVCTLYRTCRTAAVTGWILPTGTAGAPSATCSSAALAKPYVGTRCMADTAWFDCANGKPFCCTENTADSNSPGCTPITGLNIGYCSRTGPGGAVVTAT